MLLFDKDIGYTPLTSFLLQVVLELSTIIPFVELDDDRFDFGVSGCKKSLGPFTIWTPALGEHNNGVSIYGVIDNFFGGRHRYKVLIDADDRRSTLDVWCYIYSSAG